MLGVHHKLIGCGWGVALSIFLGYKKIPYSEALLAGIASVIGSMSPDVDHDATKAGRTRKTFIKILKILFNITTIGGLIISALYFLGEKFKIIPHLRSNKVLIYIVMVLIGSQLIATLVKYNSVFKWAIKHRGIMHTLIIPTLCWVESQIIKNNSTVNMILLGWSFGYCSHIFADMLTIEGCPILFPITKRNIHLLPLRTSNKYCVIVAWIVALLPVLITYYILRFNKPF